jgi:dihydroxyacetone kinase DhaKLM complex PTS-EIIA-like component DhaM
MPSPVGTFAATISAGLATFLDLGSALVPVEEVVDLVRSAGHDLDPEHPG